MASNEPFGWKGFLWRFAFAAVVVFATYNPEGLSYIDWILRTQPDISVFQLFIGVCLLIGWVILVRATLGSLGIIGIVLASAFFGLALWLVISFLGLSPGNLRVSVYIIEIMLISVLSTGVSWSHIRRRLTGQVDTDELARDA